MFAVEVRSSHAVLSKPPLSLPRNVLWTCCSALLTHSQITSGLDNSLAVIFLYPDWFRSVALRHTRAYKPSVIQCNTLQGKLIPFPRHTHTQL